MLQEAAGGPTCACAGFPVVKAGREEAVGREEHQQAVRDHTCKVGNGMAQVVPVPDAVGQ